MQIKAEESIELGKAIDTIAAVLKIHANRLAKYNHRIISLINGLVKGNAKFFNKGQQQRFNEQ